MTQDPHTETSRRKMRTCSKLCNECPFSANSTPGYLGPLEPSFARQHMDAGLPFACHLSLNSHDRLSFDDVANGVVPVCRGYLASAKRDCRRFRGVNGYAADLNRLLDTIDARDTALTPRQFERHHSQTPRP